MKRAFDLVVSLITLIILSPIFLLCYLLVLTTMGFPVIFKQRRVGINNIDFTLFKFRTMSNNAHKGSAITTGNNDPRITPVGAFLRKYKLDEIPQLINVLIGDMSLVGPRPEVRKYVDLYTEEQFIVLSVKPGITDYASIEYSNEGELLQQTENPEQFYIEEIIPAKIALNKKYINNQSIKTDLHILWLTFMAVVNRKDS